VPGPRFKIDKMLAVIRYRSSSIPFIILSGVAVGVGLIFADLIVCSSGRLVSRLNGLFKR